MSVVSSDINKMNNINEVGMATAMAQILSIKSELASKNGRDFFSYAEVLKTRHADDQGLKLQIEKLEQERISIVVEEAIMQFESVAHDENKLFLAVMEFEKSYVKLPIPKAVYTKLSSEKKYIELLKNIEYAKLKYTLPGSEALVHFIQTEVIKGKRFTGKPENLNIYYLIAAAIDKSRVDIVESLVKFSKENMNIIFDQLAISSGLKAQIFKQNNYYIPKNPTFNLNFTSNFENRCFERNYDNNPEPLFDTLLSLAFRKYNPMTQVNIVRLLLKITPNEKLNMNFSFYQTPRFWREYSYLHAIIEGLQEDRLPIAYQLVDILVAHGYNCFNYPKDHDSPFAHLVALFMLKLISPEVFRSFSQFLIKKFDIDHTIHSQCREFSMRDTASLLKFNYYYFSAPFHLGIQQAEFRFLLADIQNNAISQFETLAPLAITNPIDEMEDKWCKILKAFTWSKNDIYEKSNFKKFMLIANELAQPETGQLVLKETMSCMNGNSAVAKIGHKQLEEYLKTGSDIIEVNLGKHRANYMNSTQYVIPEQYNNGSGSSQTWELGRKLSTLTENLLLHYLHIPVTRAIKEATIAGFVLNRNATPLPKEVEPIIVGYLSPTLLPAFERGKTLAKKIPTAQLDVSETTNALVKANPFEQILLCAPGLEVYIEDLKLQMVSFKTQAAIKADNELRNEQKALCTKTLNYYLKKITKDNIKAIQTIFAEFPVSPFHTQFEWLSLGVDKICGSDPKNDRFHYLSKIKQYFENSIQDDNLKDELLNLDIIASQYNTHELQKGPILNANQIFDILLFQVPIELWLQGVNVYLPPNTPYMDPHIINGPMNVTHLLRLDRALSLDGNSIFCRLEPGTYSNHDMQIYSNQLKSKNLKTDDERKNHFEQWQWSLVTQKLSNGEQQALNQALLKCKSEDEQNKITREYLLSVMAYYLTERYISNLMRKNPKNWTQDSHDQCYPTILASLAGLKLENRHSMLNQKNAVFASIYATSDGNFTIRHPSETAHSTAAVATADAPVTPAAGTGNLMR